MAEVNLGLMELGEALAGNRARPNGPARIRLAIDQAARDPNECAGVLDQARSLEGFQGFGHCAWAADLVNDLADAPGGLAGLKQQIKNDPLNIGGGADA